MTAMNPSELESTEIESMVIYDSRYKENKPFYWGYHLVLLEDKIHHKLRFAVWIYDGCDWQEDYYKILFFKFLKTPKESERERKLLMAGKITIKNIKYKTEHMQRLSDKEIKFMLDMIADQQRIIECMGNQGRGNHEVS